MRQWRRSLSAIALLLALGQAPALAATIAVAPGIPPDINADGLCALIEAIDNANADAQTHADCVAGNGADTIVLPARSTQLLTAADNSTLGPTGLPLITSTVTIQGRNSTIRRESGAPYGFRILAVASSGDLTLHRTTVSGGGHSESYSFPGGGVYNRGTLTLTNSTVSGNFGCCGGGGGGVYNMFNTGTLTLTRALISGNYASYAPEVFVDGTIVANNYNLFGHDGDAGVFGFSPGPTDLVPSEGLGAILKPLANNGGPTKTHALPAASPAIDASPDDADCAATDQRGVSRPQGPACDIGAFERRQSP